MREERSIELVDMLASEWAGKAVPAQSDQATPADISKVAIRSLFRSLERWRPEDLDLLARQEGLKRTVDCWHARIPSHQIRRERDYIT